MTMDETTPDTIRKVPASAGAQWLIDGFLLLKASPRGLGAMGLAYGAFSAVIAIIAIAIPQTAFALQTMIIVIAPVVTAALVWGAHEVAQGRKAGIGLYVEPIRQGKLPALLGTLSPYVVLVAILVVLLRVLLSTDDIQVLGTVWQKMQNAQPGAQPDPRLLAALPAGRVLFWMMCGVVLSFAAFLMTFVAVPAVMLGGQNGGNALRNSWHASVRNLPAVLVFVIVVVVMFFGLLMLVAILGALIGVIAGQAAQMVVVQMVFTAIMTTVAAGAVMSAWQSMFGQEGAPPPLPSGQLLA